MKTLAVQYINDLELEAQVRDHIINSGMDTKRWPVVYTYHDGTYGLICRTRCAELPNERMYDVEQTFVTDTCTPVRRYLALLESDPIYDQYAHTRRTHLQNFDIVAFGSETLHLLNNGQPVVGANAHRRFCYVANRLYDLTAGTFIDAGNADTWSIPIAAYVCLISDEDQLQDVLIKCAQDCNPTGLITSVSYMRIRDAVIVYQGAPISDEWTTVRVSPAAVDTVPMLAVCLAITGSYKRSDYSYTALFDGRSRKRHTDYYNTRQPYSVRGYDIITQPVRSSEVFLKYIGADLIGETFEDFHNRSADFFNS